MEYLVILTIIIFALLAKGIYDKLTFDKKVLLLLQQKFGSVPKENYTEAKLNSLKAFYEEVKRDSCDIDEITWNDLDLNDLFFLLNNTESAVGEEYLYAMLHQPEFSLQELSERERLVLFFKENAQKRQKIQLALRRIGKNNRVSIFACMRQMNKIRRESVLIHFLPWVFLLLSIGVMFLQISVGIIALIVAISYSFMSYFKRKGELDVYLSTLSSLVLLLFATEEIAGLSIEEIAVYSEKMKQLNRHFSGFKKNFWIIGNRKPTGDIVDSLLIYLKMLLHLDLIKFNRMLTIYDRYEAELIELYKTAGYLDALCSVASFRALMPVTCVPELLDGSQPVYEAWNLYHPLIENPVKNTILSEQSVLLTGSNASGKSTFLKSVAINAILAQTIHTVLADRYRASLFQVFSSMSLRDSLSGNESYFIVEIKSLKRMFEASRQPVCTLCFVDEVLRGTNTIERIAASREVLSGLDRENVLIFAATHDIELTYLLEQKFSNYHFEETVTDQEVTFDYLLREGRATSRNAIRLLKMLGYPQEVIDRAEQTAEHFLTTGEWK